MLRGEIEVWKKGDYRPFTGFFEIESDNQVKEGTLFSAGAKKKLKCRLRSENPRHLACGVDLKEKPGPREILRFKFLNLPKKGRTKVQGTNFLGQNTSWLCTFTTPD